MASEASALLSQLDSLCQRISKFEWRSEDTAIKRKACTTLRNLSVDLEETGDLVDRVPMDNVLLRLALDLDLFSILAKGQEPIAINTLSKETGADPTLLLRILRALNAIGAVKQVGTDRFAASKFSKAFTTQKGINGAKFSFEFAAPTWNQLPKYLAENKYINPSNPQYTALHLAFPSKKHFFALLEERPEILRAFATYMTVQKEGRPNFAEFFPVDEQLRQGFHHDDPDGIMFVDVGGGLGHEIVELRRSFPHLPGRMVLQDRPEVVQGVTANDHMEVMDYDFFTPQPIKGARAYYFRNIFHDWSDADCMKILHETVAAMTPGYSKVLINELVIPDENAGTFMTRSDINLMALVGAMERSEKQWRQLLTSMGLRILRIWTAEAETERIIECELD